jgi:hypothetical protein
MREGTRPGGLAQSRSVSTFHSADVEPGRLFAGASPGSGTLRTSRLCIVGLGVWEAPREAAPLPHALKRGSTDRKFADSPSAGENTSQARR